MSNKTHIIGEYESSDELVLKIKMPGTKYLDIFIKRWRSATDLLLTGYFPNAKEITESMGIIKFAENYVNWQDDSVTHYILGDGIYPRTASMSAFSTKWKNVSIDPIMKVEKAIIRHHPLNCESTEIRNVRPIKMGCQDYKYEEQDSGNIALVSSVHCHASTEQIQAFLKEILPHFKKVFLIDLPCCVKHKFKTVIGKEYYDMNIFSPHRTLYGYVIKNDKMNNESIY